MTGAEWNDGVTWIQVTTVGDTGEGRVGVGGSTTGSDPVVQIAVMSVDPGGEYWLRLGETFPVGDQTWRLADIDFRNANDFDICVRRVDENEPQDPPQGRLWEEAEFLPHGPLSFEQIAALEAELGRRLPLGYGRWLADTNGARAVRAYKFKEYPFLMTPERPFFGVHPDFPAFDLVAVQRQWRDPYLPGEYLVIAMPGGAGGLLTARPDGVLLWLPPEAMAGEMDPVDRARLLQGAGRDIDYFLACLVAYEPDLPPAGLIMPGDPRHHLSF